MTKNPVPTPQTNSSSELETLKTEEEWEFPSPLSEAKTSPILMDSNEEDPPLLNKALVVRMTDDLVDVLENFDTTSLHPGDREFASLVRHAQVCQAAAAKLWELGNDARD